ncbi:UNVERIFIED_CONTAM: hypothetical protein ABIC26_000370 [Paenibacillus sp. PvR008]
MERRTVGLSVKNLGRKMLIAAVSTLLISTVAIPGAEAAMSDRECRWTDWGRLGDHENDMEGMLLVVRKPGVTRKDGSVVDRSQFPNGELELVCNHKI